MEQITENDVNEIEHMLAMCTGSVEYYRYKFARNLEIIYTDGINILVEMCKAYWLVDAICSYQRKNIRSERFQIWTFERKFYKNGKEYWLLEMKTDTNATVIIKQKISFSDFPLDDIKLYLIDGVLLLPSEY